MIFFWKKLVKIKKIVLLRLQLKNDSLAQLVEHLPFKQRVPGSSPGRVTPYSPEVFFRAFLWVLSDSESHRKFSLGHPPDYLTKSFIINSLNSPSSSFLRNKNWCKYSKERSETECVQI